MKLSSADYGYCERENSGRLALHIGRKEVEFVVFFFGQVIVEIFN
jgi:hypothetical protein